MNTPLRVQLKKLHPDAIVPKFQTEGAAGFDLHALVPGSQVWVFPGESIKFRTGIAVSIGSPDWGLFLFPRSGLGTRGIRLANCVGVVDSDYQGELMVAVHNDSNQTYAVVSGDRIAQGVFMPVRQAEFIVVDSFKTVTKRGSNGFGSTGVQA